MDGEVAQSIVAFINQHASRLIAEPYEVSATDNVWGVIVRSMSTGEAIYINDAEEPALPGKG